MSFVGDAIGSIVNPILGKPDPDAQERAIDQSTALQGQAGAMATDYYNQTGGMRKSLIDRLSGFLSGTTNPVDEATRLNPLLGSATNRATDYYAGNFDPTAGNPLLKSLADRSQQYLSGGFDPGAANPILGQLVDRSKKFLEGNLDPTASAMYAPTKMAAERQFNTARQGVLADAPAGGALLENLANLQGQKAASLTDAVGGIVKDEYGKTFDTANMLTQANENEAGRAVSTSDAINNILSGEKNTALSVTDMINQIIQGEYNKAYGMGQGSQSVAASGIAGAGDSSNKLLQALAGQQSAGAQGTGNIVSLLRGILELMG
jgi:hypothetical protein